MARTYERANTDNHATVRNTAVMAVMSVAREFAAASSDEVCIGLVYPVMVYVKMRFQTGWNVSGVRVVSSVAAMCDCRLAYVVRKVSLHRYNGTDVLISRRNALAIYINERRNKENQRSRGRS
jgi:hypothetical protein